MPRWSHRRHRKRGRSTSPTLSPVSSPTSTGRSLLDPRSWFRRARPEIRSATSIPSPAATSAPAKAETRPAPGETASAPNVSPPSPEELYRLLLKHFSTDVFPADFRWRCSCGAHKDGFPGCQRVGCFLNKVFLALTDWNQLQATREVKIPIKSNRKGDLLLVRPDRFSDERYQAYKVDLIKVKTLLLEAGVRLD